MKILITISGFLLSFSSYAQQSDREAIYNIFQKNNLGVDASLQSAQTAFENFISHHPNSNYNLIALFYLGEIAHRLDKTDSALLFYNKALAFTIPDSLDEMSCRNSAAKRLAEIYIAKGIYCSALDYLDIAANNFLPRYSCGLAHMENRAKMNILYSKCYMGLGEPAKAISLLSPYAFAFGFGNSDKIVTELYNDWLKVYSKEDIKKEFVDLENKILITKELIRDYTFYHAKIKIFNSEVEIPSFELSLDKMTEQQQIHACATKIRTSEIYKLAEN